MNIPTGDRRRGRHLLPVLLFGGLVLAAVVFRAPLLAWFTGGPQERSSTVSPVEAPASQPVSVAASQTEGPPASQPTVAPSSQPAAVDGSVVGTPYDPDRDEIAYYTCSMHPSVKRSEPGTCPICSMGLVPVMQSELDTGVITVGEQRRQRIGVRTAPVVKGPMRVQVRAVGRLVYDETQLSDVTLKLDGWIEQLDVNTTGQIVRRGETLFTLYSPELYAAQEEYLLALRSRTVAQQTSAPERADYLVRAARQRLRLWDLTDEQIARIESTAAPFTNMPFLAPVSGYVIEKNVVEGAAVRAGRRLYRMAGLDPIWVEAEIYEADLALIAVGQPAAVTLPYLPGRRYEGRISYIYPYLEARTRTGSVRIELANPQLELRPDMYADVEIEIDRGDRLQVPKSAVIYTGPRRLVFLDLGDGRLRPQVVELGAKNDVAFEVLSGLREGDTVVTSGHFLLAAESRIRSALPYWGGDDDTR